jgi:tripartite-type tricarboxylate transporter receptor subunit TctC
MKTILAAAVSALAVLGAPLAQAQAWPDKVVKIVLPGGPGGPGDRVSRLIVLPVAERLGKPVVMDYQAGAGGNIGMAAAAKASADGHTFVNAALAQRVLNPLMDSKLPYDAEKDFVPVIMLAKIPYVMVVHNSVPARSYKEVLALLKASPGKLNYASHGNGTTAHVAAELFKSMTGASITHVPYKSDAAAMSDLLGGHVQVMFNVNSSVAKHIDAGTLHGIATAAGERVPLLPKLPTFEEQGLAGFTAETWYALLAPAGTPAVAIERMNAEINKVLADPAVRASLGQSGLTPGGGSAADLAKFIEAEKAKWRPTVEAAGLKK